MIVGRPSDRSTEESSLRSPRLSDLPASHSDHGQRHGSPGDQRLPSICAPDKASLRRQEGFSGAIEP